MAFCDRDGERGQRVAAELETAGAEIAFTQADVGIDEVSAASWNEIPGANLMSYVFCAKAAVPLKRRNQGGAIVNVASVRPVCGAANATRPVGLNCKLLVSSGVHRRGVN